MANPEIAGKKQKNQHGETVSEDSKKKEEIEKLEAMAKSFFDEDKDEEAFKCLLKAAELGSEITMYRLARMYEKGEGVPKSDEEAVKWYEKAIKAGHKTSIERLASKYFFGEGVPKSYEKAIELYKKAAETDEYVSEDLGFAYHCMARKDPVYFAESAKWYKKAAELGILNAMITYGELCEKGEGVPQSYEEAEYWYGKAVDMEEDISAIEPALMGLQRIDEARKKSK